MAPFEALHGRKCRTPLCRNELDEALIIGPELIQETTEKIRRIQEHIKAVKRVMQIIDEDHWSSKSGMRYF